MSVTQKMFACSGFVLIIVLVFTQAVPVPAPEEIQPANGRLESVQTVEYAVEPAAVPVDVVVADPSESVRSARSASPFFGIIAGYEKPRKKQHHNHHHGHQEEYEHEYHHRPQYHHEEHEPHYYHHKPQHHQQGGGAGSFASAGSFAGGSGGGAGHSQSSANSQSASFGFGPFQASYSASSAHSGSHAGFSNDY